MPFYAVITVFFLSFSANSYADDLFDMLQRMSDADKDQNYQGTFILRKSDKLSTMKVLHGNSEKGVWENLETLDGESKKVVRRNNKVFSIFPDRELVIVRNRTDNQSLHLQLPENIGQLHLFYTINRLKDDRIAGIQTLVVDLVPKDRYRYGYRYWIDKDTGMLLRSDLIAENNLVVEQMMFTSLKYLESSPVQAIEPSHFEQFKQLKLDEQKTDVLHSTPQEWVVNELPKGFMLTQSMLLDPKPSVADNQSSTRLLHMVYSDGLASVSIFIEQNNGAKNHLQGASTMGAVNAFGHSNGEHYVTVVGEVPLTTAQSMARSTVRLQ